MFVRLWFVEERASLSEDLVQLRLILGVKCPSTLTSAVLITTGVIVIKWYHETKLNSLKLFK